MPGLPIILPDFGPHPPVHGPGFLVVTPFQMACKVGPAAIHVAAGLRQRFPAAPFPGGVNACFQVHQLVELRLKFLGWERPQAWPLLDATQLMDRFEIILSDSDGVLARWPSSTAQPRKS